MKRMRKILLFLTVLSLVFMTLVTSQYQVSAAKKFKIVLVAKQEGIPWFDDMRKGVTEFNSKYSDVVEAKQIAPEAGDSAKQNQMVEDLIAQGVDAICVVPNDPNAMKPVLTKAKQKGIVIISHEASGLAGTNVVDFDLEAFNNKDFGILMFDTLAKAMGGQGKFAAEVGGLTMQTHMEWYNAGLKYVKAKYPKMKIVTSQPFEDKNDDALARDNAMQILKAYPDLKGFIGTSVSAGSNFAAVLKEKQKKNISVVSLGIPSVDDPYLKDGYMVQAQLWRPADAGYAACLAALRLLKGEKIKSGVNLDRTGYSSVKVQGKVIYGNAPLVLTKETVGKYNF
jgi:simple sugar transport system substrate-binding protein